MAERAEAKTHGRSAVSLACNLGSVATARRFVADRVGAVLGADRVDDVVLLTSEVATNGVRHAGSRLGLAVEVGDGRVTVEVTDSSSVGPQRRPSPPEAEEGRGLHLLDLLADDWGWERTPSGKTVWFSVACPARG